MDGNFKGAREFFLRSLLEARKIGMKEGIMESQAALRRVEDASRKSDKASSPPTKASSK